MLADIFPTSCNVLHQILDRKVFQVLHLILSLDKNRDENVQVQEKSTVKIESKQNLVTHLFQFSEKQVICPILRKKKKIKTLLTSTNAQSIKHSIFIKTSTIPGGKLSRSSSFI